MTHKFQVTFVTVARRNIDALSAAAVFLLISVLCSVSTTFARSSSSPIPHPTASPNDAVRGGVMKLQPMELQPIDARHLRRAPPMPTPTSKL